jgi:hypothetical protein
LPLSKAPPGSGAGVGEGPTSLLWLYGTLLCSYDKKKKETRGNPNKRGKWKEDLRWDERKGRRKEEERKENEKRKLEENRKR